MSAVWRDSITMIRNGDSVNEQTIGVVTSQLAERTSYLKERLDASAVGEGLMLFSQAIHTSVTEGMVVYFDEATETFKPAIADTSNDSSGLLKLANSAYAVGIVARKLSTVAADILIRGRYRGLTLTDASSNTLSIGHYWLSANDAGYLVSSRPAVAIYVCQVTTDGIIVNPTPREVLEDHIHYKFELRTTAAGTSVCRPSNRVSIDYPDNTVEGWLPADDAIFNGNAPAGAYFGYNWTANPQLSAVWPPQPLSGAYLEINGIGVSLDHVIIDKNGIWWMTNCNSDAPWAEDTCLSSSTAVEQSSSSAWISGEPRPAPCEPVNRRIQLWFTRMVAKTDQTSVTGLKAASGSPIDVTGCSSPDANGYCAGKLVLDLSMEWGRTGNSAGSEVVKDITGYGDLAVGHVTEGIKGAGLISVSGTRSLTGGYSAGSVTITGLDPTAITRKLDVGLVALSGASESVYSDIVHYVGLKNGLATSFIGQVRIPQLSMTIPRVYLDLWFATPTAGTPPDGVTIQYAVVDDADYAGMSSSSGAPGIPLSSMPTSWSTAVQLNLDDVGELNAGNYFKKLALDIVIASNQILLFRIARTASDSYTGELAVINMVATVYDNA